MKKITYVKHTFPYYLPYHYLLCLALPTPAHCLHSRACRHRAYARACMRSAACVTSILFSLRRLLLL